MTQSRSFPGLCNYYRRFIRDYATISAPLYSALSAQEKRIEWSDEYVETINNLKIALSSAPVLAYPDKTKRMILDTDASFGAIGAVLRQKNDKGLEKVIA